MSISKTIPYFLTLILISSRLQAAEPVSAAPSNEAIQQQLQAMQKGLQEMQSRHQTEQSRHQAELDALKKQLADQQVVIDTLRQGPPGLPAPPAQAAIKPALGDPSPTFPTTDPSLVQDSGAASPPSALPARAADPTGNMFPTTDPSVVTHGPSAASPPGLLGSSGQPGGGAAKGSYLNISFDSVFTGAASTASDLSSLEVGDHDPQQRGFNARNIELALDGAVDPYFEGFANIVFKLDNNNETSVEAEEVFGQTTSLPFGLQAKGGQFFSPFGRLNPTHPHTWDFVDAPLVNGLMLGPDGLRGVGAQIAWVIPTPFYAQALVAVQNGQGGTAYSFRNPGDDGTFYGRQTIDRQADGLSDMAIAPRLEASYDLTPTQTILGGVSAAFGSNDTGENTRTQIYGADLFYKWKPANAEGGWPFVKWQSEALIRRYEAGQGLDDSFPTAETFDDWGAYSQVVWGFHKGWSAGFRGDYVHMESSDITDDPQRQSRCRLSADLSWYPSEFSKLRLQYNYDMLKSTDFEPSSDENSLFLMYEFSLGAHGAHKY